MCPGKMPDERQKSEYDPKKKDPNQFPDCEFANIYDHFEKLRKCVTFEEWYDFSGLKSKSLKRRSDQRYAHFSIIGM